MPIKPGSWLSVSVNTANTHLTLRESGTILPEGLLDRWCTEGRRASELVWGF